MLTRTFKRVKLKNKIDCVVREQYLRDDVHCNSPLCKFCSPEKASKTMKLNKDIDHYAVPCLDVLENYLEILECQELSGIIIVQSLLLKVLSSIGHRFGNRVVNICKDMRRGNVVFLNEISVKAHVERESSKSFQDWLMMCTIQSAKFYAQHLSNMIPIILISEDTKTYKSLIEDDHIQIMSLTDYLKTKYPDCDSLIQLYDSLTLALSAGTVKDLSKSYDNYFSSEVLVAGIKSGQFFKGHLQVNKHNASEEAFLCASKTFSKGKGDIFISGMIDRNRAIHGDEVVVELYPESQWKSRCMRLIDNPYEKGNEIEQVSLTSHTVPTGKVVGILDRCWRNYVATLPEEDKDSSQVSRKERILVVPYDYRIPKIRILTKQAESIRNQRIVVRIDSWEKDSQYPNGHFVQALGEIGDMETEIQSLLIEHNASDKEFPPNIIQELPSSSNENPWQLEEQEISKRRDLRNSHLIFSIDPKGCEDVDDALSVRDLPNGNLELGVHIADVTYFVQPLSSVDLEAKSRSTSLYLPDRRYDMLPHILSGNLCSLLGNVDRYAVSVLWELDSCCRVQNVWYGRTIINSSYKLCYEAAQDILCDVPVHKVIADIPELQELSEKDLSLKFLELKASISKLYHIASILRRDRLNAGGLELSSINMKFEIDKMLPSIVSDVKSSTELAIHKTVAECMIFANHWVGKKIWESFPHQSVLRRHPNPRETDLADLQKLALSRGFSLDIQSNRKFSVSLEKAIDENDSTFNQVLRVMAARAMNQATYFCTGCYSVEEFYHYGLGLDKYTHFTSPIRRYADILVHRLLLASVKETHLDTSLEMLEIEKLCNHMNEKHKASQDLEKDAKHLFLSAFIEELQSQEGNPCVVNGVIYSLLTNGVLVFVPKYGIKGAVPLCNKEKKVAVIKNGVQWVEGHLDASESCLTVKAADISQKYSIFNHVTLSLRVLKSRSHQSKIVLDIVKNEPYLSDLKDVPIKDMEVLNLEPNNESDVKNSKEGSPDVKVTDFNLYLFLEKIKTLSIED